MLNDPTMMLERMDSTEQGAKDRFISEDSKLKGQ